MTEFEKDYEQGVKDLAERLRRFYTCLHGETNSSTVAYHVEQIKKDLLKEEKNNV